MWARSWITPSPTFWPAVSDSLRRQASWAGASCLWDSWGWWEAPCYDTPPGHHRRLRSPDPPRDLGAGLHDGRPTPLGRAVAGPVSLRGVGLSLRHRLSVGGATARHLGARAGRLGAAHAVGPQLG